MDTVRSCCERLAELLHESDEYKAFVKARAAAEGDSALKPMLDEYRRLQLRIQASQLCGGEDEADLNRLQKLGEYLMMNPTASEYIFARYRISRLLSDVYKTLALSVDSDLSVIDD